MDRGRREEDRNRDYHEDRGRQDTRERRPDRGQREYRDRRGDNGWACGPRSGTDDGRSGVPRPSGGCQFETRYDSQALQHQPRSEAMAVHNSGARRGESEQQYDEPSLRRDEPQRRYDEPSHRRDGPQRRYEEPREWRHRDEPQRRNDESGSCGSGLVSTASECVVSTATAWVLHCHSTPRQTTVMVTDAINFWLNLALLILMANKG